MAIICSKALPSPPLQEVIQSAPKFQIASSLPQKGRSFLHFLIFPFDEFIFSFFHFPIFPFLHFFIFPFFHFPISLKWENEKKTPFFSSSVLSVCLVCLSIWPNFIRLSFRRSFWRFRRLFSLILSPFCLTVCRCLSVVVSGSWSGVSAVSIDGSPFEDPSPLPEGRPVSACGRPMTTEMTGE